MAKVKKIYVGPNSEEVELGGGGAGTAINASMFFDNDGRMFIKCNAGEIQEGDIAKLARYHAGKVRFTKERYRGWIEPSPAHVKAQGLDVTLSLDHSSNGSDYWEVLIGGKSPAMYQEDAPQEDNYSLCHRQGIAVYRDGVRMTEYIHFTVVEREDETFVATIW